jgi:hypothetical protein
MSGPIIFGYNFFTYFFYTSLTGLGLTKRSSAGFLSSCFLKIVMCGEGKNGLP